MQLGTRLPSLGSCSLARVAAFPVLVPAPLGRTELASESTSQGYLTPGLELEFLRALLFRAILGRQKDRSKGEEGGKGKGRTDDALWASHPTRPGRRHARATGLPSREGRSCREVSHMCGDERLNDSRVPVEDQGVETTSRVEGGAPEHPQPVLGGPPYSSAWRQEGPAPDSTPDHWSALKWALLRLPGKPVRLRHRCAARGGERGRRAG